jgi:hypothetical protein
MVEHLSTKREGRWFESNRIGNITFVPRTYGGYFMGWKCDKCKKSYKFIHDGNPKSLRLKQMMNGIFFCLKCHEKHTKIPDKLKDKEHEYFVDKMMGVIL